jgi:hypothetical protein
MAFGFLEDIGIKKDGLVGTAIGTVAGAFFGPAMQGIGQAAGFVGGTIKGIQKDKAAAQQQAYDDSENARIQSVMRSYMAQKQTSDTIAAGFKRNKTNSGLPDPIGEAQGLMGEGLQSMDGSGTAGTF